MAAAMMTPSTQRFLMPTRPRFRYRMSHLSGQRSLSYVCECGKNWKLQNEPKFTPVYHGENGVRTLRELSRSYLTVTKDLTRVMNRLKALYRSWAFPCTLRDRDSPTSAVTPRWNWQNDRDHIASRKRLRRESVSHRRSRPLLTNWHALFSIC
jgi:hypothetical protein